MRNLVLLCNSDEAITFKGLEYSINKLCNALSRKEVRFKRIGRMVKIIKDENNEIIEEIIQRVG